MDHKRPDSIPGYVHPDEPSAKPNTDSTPYSVYTGKKKGPVYVSGSSEGNYKTVDVDSWSKAPDAETPAE